MSSISGPFLVPFMEGFGTHLVTVHHRSGRESRIDRNEVCWEGGLEVGPSAKVDRLGGECGVLFVFGPFSSRGANVEVRESSGNSKVFIREGSSVEEKIGFKGGPKGLSFDRGAIKWFRRRTHKLCRLLMSSHDRRRWWQWRRSQWRWWSQRWQGLSRTKG